MQCHLPAVGVAVVTFGEDDSIKWVVKFHIHLHSHSVALYVEAGDLRHNAEYIADDAELRKRKGQLNT